MTNTDAYIIFEADQVLTNDHLNEMFDYLDIQERLTRNKLIGIGIVCGLEITNQPTSINISKGCGVTSKGYLIVWEGADLTQYISYTLPANPLYKPFINEATGNQYELLRMISDDEAKSIEGTRNPVLPVLKDKIVVLFLEANEIDLKNCDMQDCNEKGRQMELTVRPLLIGRADMEQIIIKQKKLSGEDGLSNSYIERLGLKEIPFKRFDVKATPLSDAFDIYDAYLRCFDNNILPNIADAYSQCYAIFQYILTGYGNTNPFKDLQNELTSKLDLVKKSMPLYIQYFYDFLDDLIKAYQEFKERSFEVITECCPDEDLFPMHLMLGEAAVDTRDDIRSPFRQYFISSPLFNNQADLLTEVKLLFDRMVNLVRSFFIPQFNLKQGVPIRITPSKWSIAPLSTRSIPYYYNINKIAPSWNPLKSRKGRSNFNLSYNADKYTSLPPDIISNPLQYNIEPYDFYRIEGHIGQEWSSVLNVILSARNSNRLPFDVIALKASADAADTPIKYDCHFEDLEAQFKLISAELACKMHEPLCIAAKVPSLLMFKITPVATPFNFLETFSAVHALALNDVVARKNVILTNFVQTLRFTRKGDFLKTYCPVIEGTLGYEYTQPTNKFFPRPAQIDLTTTAGSKAALLHIIDITEALMQTITGASTIYNFNYVNFNRIYDDMISYFTEFMQAVLNADGQDKRLSPLLYGMLEAVVTSCIDDKLKALTDEYTKRVEKIQKQNLLSQYLSTNPGIDHKAGVPRGGTFIIVYYEDAPASATPAATASTLASLTAVNTTAALATASAATTVTSSNTKRLAATSVISKDNLTKILKIFDTNELQLTEAQATSLKNLTLQNFAAAAVRDPFIIPDKAVVADFYLPYLCCSDCPPVAYILPKPPQVFTIEPTIFCSNDAQAHAFKTDPAVEDINDIDNKDGLKMEIDDKGNVFFIPSKQGVQQTTDYHLTLKGISVSLKVVAMFEVDITPQPVDGDPLSFKFVASNTANRIVEWNFGDGTPVSTDQSPIHKFTITADADTQSFLVNITVTDGPCIVKKEVEIKLTKPKQVFTIDPAIFCSNDEQPHTFNIAPVADDINNIKNTNGLKLEQDAAGNISFIPAKQDAAQGPDYNLTYKGENIDLKIVPIFDVVIKADSVDTDPFSRKFTASNTSGKTVQWNFGDGSPTSTEESPVHAFNISDNEQTFLVTILVTDGPCVVSKETSVTISKPKPDAFSIDPTVFCSQDTAIKTFTTEPLPADIAEIQNPDSLLMGKDAAGNVSFVPEKQNLSQTKNYTLTYRSINASIRIIVPDAGFTMNLEHNDSPVAVFPIFLSLKAKEGNADSYKWKLTNVTGFSLDFATNSVANINLAQLIVPGNNSINITVELTVGFERQTGVNCVATAPYIITGDVFGKHLNHGEFDNLTP